MNIGARIREIRMSRGFTSKYVSEKLAKKGAWLTNREKGYIDITVNELIDIAKVLDVPISTFFDEWNTQHSFSYEYMQDVISESVYRSFMQITYEISLALKNKYNN